MTITQEEWEAYLAAITDPAVRDRVDKAADFHKAHTPESNDGHLRANVTMLIGAKHSSDLHPSGYWTGNDVYLQLDHVISIFEIRHPGKKGVFLFDNSTGHGKMAADALLAEGLIKGPGGKVVSKLRETTWKDTGGGEHSQSFVFKEGDELLYDATGVRANPLDDDGVACFPVGEIIEARMPKEKKKYTKGVTVVARQEDNTYTLRYPLMGEEVVRGVDVANMQMPVAVFKKGQVPDELIGQSKGLKQIPLERGLIDESSPELKCKCGPKEKEKLRFKKQVNGIGAGESTDVPAHAGWTDGAPCCLEFMLSEQPDFKDQRNAIEELVASRGHHCIFLPKFHPELNCIERYWSRVKWHARQYCDGTLKGLKWTAEEAMIMSPETCDLALIRRYFRTSWRWVDAYRRGLDGVLANFAVRKSKCHRFVTDAVDLEVNRLSEERKAAALERASTEPVTMPMSLAELDLGDAMRDIDLE